MTTEQEKCGYPGCGRERESGIHTCRVEWCRPDHEPWLNCHPFVEPTVEQKVERSCGCCERPESELQPNSLKGFLPGWTTPNAEGRAMPKAMCSECFACWYDGGDVGMDKTDPAQIKAYVLRKAAEKANPPTVETVVPPSDEPKGDGLEACPFCKSSNLEPASLVSIHWVRCTDCDAEGPYADDAASARAAWNRRAASLPADPPSQQTEPDHLRRDCPIFGCDDCPPLEEEEARNE